MKNTEIKKVVSKAYSLHGALTALDMFIIDNVSTTKVKKEALEGLCGTVTAILSLSNEVVAIIDELERGGVDNDQQRQ